MTKTLLYWRSCLFYVCALSSPARHRKPSLLRRCGRGLEKMFYTYVLKSRRDGKLYIGYTQDLKKRFSEHNNSLVEATKHRIPLYIVYYEACLKKEKAIEREKYFKTGFGRRFLKNRV